MPAERFYLDAPLQSGLSVVLQDQEFHHLVHVMRTKVGEEVELVNGRGQLAQGIVEHFDKKRCHISLSMVREETKSLTEMILVQGIPRANRLDFILEKGTELGMTQLWLLPTKLSERKQFNEHQLEKMKGQMIAAMKQCGRLYLPEIVMCDSVASLQKLPYPAFYGDVDPQAPSFEKCWKECRETLQKGVLFFTGPESGFTADEVGHLKALQAQGVKLHPNILRTDTASLAALSLISHWYSL
jgi:16S rRNA (uracil1498-N3)-methyltransferase